MELTKKAILKSDYANEFANSKCCLTISVGQPSHEYDKLQSTLIAVNHNFNACKIMVCDSLQRHTIQILTTIIPNEVHDYSNFLGDEWLSRNMPYINALNIPYHITRWDEWFAHPNFGAKRKLIDELYSSDESFVKSIYDTVKHFLDRNDDKMVVNSETAFELSKEYLLEECAVMLLLADDSYPFEIYPNARNLALDYIYTVIISPIDKRMMRPVSIKFKNRAGQPTSV